MKKNVKTIIKQGCFFIVLALVASHIMVAKGEPYTFYELLGFEGYYLSMGGCFLITMTTIAAIVGVNWLLDRRFAPGSGNMYMRFVLQVGFGVLFIVGLTYELVAVYFDLRETDISETDYNKNDLVAMLEFVVLINTHYFTRFYYRHSVSQTAKKPKPIDKSSELPASEASQWKRQHLSATKIVLYRLMDRHVFSFTREGKKGLLPMNTLKEVYETLDQDFFRINEQTVIHRSLILSVNRQSSILILILDSTELPEAKVSRGKVSGFKQWYTV